MSHIFGKRAKRGGVVGLRRIPYARRGQERVRGAPIFMKLISWGPPNFMTPGTPPGIHVANA